MADIDLDQLQKSLESAGVEAGKTTQILTDLASKAKDLAGITFDKITNSLKNYADVLKTTNLNSRDLRNNNISVASSFDGVAKSLSTVLALTTKFDAFKNLSVQSGAAVNTMGSQFDTLIDRFGGWERASAKLAGAGLTSLVSMGKGGVSAFLNASSSAQNLENTYINLMGATGQMGKLFDENGKLVSDLSGQVARYGSLLNNVTDITGENLDVVAKWSSQFGTIPNVLGALIKVGDDASDTTEGLTQAFISARSAGRDVKDVYNAMTTAYEKLSAASGKVEDNARRGVEMFRLMTEASNKLGLRFDDTENYLTTIADQFKMVGDNSQSAVNILERFSGALQNTGLTAKQSVQVIGDMVGAISKLDMGTKALISSRTGGPGGLQGAFRVENLARQGNIAEIAKMMEQTLRRQFGGRIYTQEEAAQSPQAAAQFMRQRSLLQSSAFGQFAQTPETASRLLEAMKAGPVATTEAIKNSFATLKDANAKGTELQQKQVNALTLINNALNRSVTLQELSFLQDSRKIVGAEGANNPLANAIKSARETAMQDIQDQYGNKNEVKSLENQQTRGNRIAGANVIDSVGVVDNVAKEGEKAVNGIIDKAKEHLDRAHKEAAQQQQNQEVERQQQLSQQAVENGKRSYNTTMRTAATQAMRQTPRTMATVVPRTADAVKHEVSVKPMEMNIVITRDPGTEVETTTNYPDANIKNVVNQQVKGYHSVVKP
jgi:hypothetical protein